ncbi:MAG: hypothetical protein AB8G11_13190 [Saprospiraceae bacterium]
MKRFSLLLLLLIIPFFVIGQSVKINDGEVLVNKEPYCLVEGEKDFPKDFIIKALDGTVLLSVKQEFVPATEQISYTYFIIKNHLNEEEFQIDQQIGNAVKLIIRSLYKNEVIVDNTIDEAGLKKYKTKNAGDFKEKYEKIAKIDNPSKPSNDKEGEEETKDELTERDRNDNIYIFGKTIKQGTTEIGSYKKEAKALQGQIIDVFIIYDVNNRLIARAEKGQFGEVIACVTKKDNEKRTLTTTSNLDSSVIEIIVKELIEYMYL